MAGVGPVLPLATLNQSHCGTFGGNVSLVILHEFIIVACLLTETRTSTYEIFFFVCQNNSVHFGFSPYGFSPYALDMEPNEVLFDTLHEQNTCN